MYSSLINNEVVVLIASRTQSILECTGVLCDEDENALKLKNVELNQAMMNFQKNMFGSEFGIYKQNLEEFIINKKYIIACYKK